MTRWCDLPGQAARRPRIALTVSRDAASSRLLGRILAAVSRLDELSSLEPGLREISSLLDDIPGISGAVFEIDAVIDFSVDPFERRRRRRADAAIDDRHRRSPPDRRQRCWSR